MLQVIPTVAVQWRGESPGLGENERCRLGEKAMTTENGESATQNSEVAFRDPVEAIKFYMEKQGLNQRDLVPIIGSRAKVSEVLSRTRGITMPMARALHRHLGIPGDILLMEPAVRTGDAASDIDWRRFPLHEMAKRGWIRASGNLRGNARELVTELIEKAGHKEVADALFRKNDQNRANAKANPYALNAWCWQILAQANENERRRSFKPIDDPAGLMTEVAKLSPAIDGPLRALDFLAEHGIAVEIARHLPGTHLDGAAMKSTDGSPVIGLTLRYDRLDHFWYTLEHELAHALYHLGDSDDPFFDDLGLKSAECKEADADAKARAALIPDDIWSASDVNTDPSVAAVIGLAYELGIHPAVVAGRYRHENKDYRRFSQLVGSNIVRDLFDV